MKGQATMEFLMVFLITMAAISAIFYPLAKAHRDFGKEAEVVKHKVDFEDFIFGAQIYCNSQFSAPSSILGKMGKGFKIEGNRVYLVLESGEKEFEGFFEGCSEGNEHEPI